MNVAITNLRIFFVVLASALAIGVYADSASKALAQGPYVTVDDAAPAVAEAEGGGFKFSLGLTNITGDEVVIGVDPTSPKVRKGCGITLDDGRTATITPATHKDVAIEFDAGCEASDVNALVLSAGPDPKQKVEVTPKDPDKPKPNWDHLGAFPASLLLGSLLAAALLLIWNVSPKRELANLPDTWKFSDSVVTNVTLIGGTLVGIVGASDVIKAFTGKESDASFALITVGAAVAAALIGLGAVVLQTFRSSRHFTAFGLMAAAVLVFSGALGELYVVWQNGRELTLGGWEDSLLYITVVLALLLVGYSYSSLKETIEQGLAAAKPKQLELSADHVAAAALTAAIHDGVSITDLLQEVRDALATENDRALADALSKTADAAPNSRVSRLKLSPVPVKAGKSALL